MIKRISYFAAALVVLAGCSSGVDLDNVPVDDKAGAPLSTTNNGANSGNTGQSGVQGNEPERDRQRFQAWPGG